jgi:hypothetical protein
VKSENHHQNEPMSNTITPEKKGPGEPGLQSGFNAHRSRNAKPSTGPTWKILRWDNRPAETGEQIPLVCEDCGRDANVPCGQLIGGSLIAILSNNGLIFDPPWFTPPDNWLPTELQCRKCGLRLVSEITEEEANHVR